MGKADNRPSFFILKGGKSGHPLKEALEREIVVKLYKSHRDHTTREWGKVKSEWVLNYP